MNFTDLLLGFCVDCNETYTPIKTSSEYNLFDKYPVTSS
jgi:hypothetical protein